MNAPTILTITGPGELEQLPCGHNSPRYNWWRTPEKQWKEGDPCPTCELIKKAKEFEEYFKSLGYSISEDWSYARRECWWEIYDGNELAAQIDKTPLKTIILALKYMHAHPRAKRIPDDLDFEINGSGKAFWKLCRLVFEREEKR